MSHQSHNFEPGDRHTPTRIQDFLILIGVVSFWALARVFIPGRPFPGRPGIPVILRSRIPGNGAASFPAKTGTVQLMSLLSFSIIVTCSRGASSALAWWVTAGCCHTATGVITLDGVLHPAALCSTRRRVGAMRQFALLAVSLTAQVAVAVVRAPSGIGNAAVRG